MGVNEWVPGGDVAPLALRPREAARALGVSERTLWALTKRGDVPHVRIGRRVLSPLDLLRTWLAERATAKAG